jgi:hypothetical protein
MRRSLIRKAVLGLLLVSLATPASAWPARSKAHFLRSWNRSTQMPLVRYYSALFQDQLQAP